MKITCNKCSKDITPSESGDDEDQGGAQIHWFAHRCLTVWDFCQDCWKEVFSGQNIKPSKFANPFGECTPRHPEKPGIYTYKDAASCILSQIQAMKERSQKYFEDTAPGSAEAEMHLNAARGLQELERLALTFIDCAKP
jgi:hypothetical protein